MAQRITSEADDLRKRAMQWRGEAVKCDAPTLAAEMLLLATCLEKAAELTQTSQRYDRGRPAVG